MRDLIIRLLVGFFLLTRSAAALQGFFRDIAVCTASLALNGDMVPHTSPKTPMTSSLLLSETFDADDLDRLKQGEKQVEFLLNNWRKKTTYCNFGEFNNELLDPANKAKLLVEAAAGGLLDYDKSATMTVKCRRDPMMVRSYAGLVDDGNPTLQNAAKIMSSEIALDRVLSGDDDVEIYMAAVDSFKKALAEVDLLTYSARTDYASTETQTAESIQKSIDDQEAGIGKKDFLAQSRDSVIKLKDALVAINKALK